MRLNRVNLWKHQNQRVQTDVVAVSNITLTDEFQISCTFSLFVVNAQRNSVPQVLKQQNNKNMKIGNNYIGSKFWAKQKWKQIHCFVVDIDHPYYTTVTAIFTSLSNTSMELTNRLTPLWLSYGGILGSSHKTKFLVV